MWLQGYNISFVHTVLETLQLEYDLQSSWTDDTSESLKGQHKAWFPDTVYTTSAVLLFVNFPNFSP